MKHFLRIAALLALIAFPSLAEAANRFAVCTTTCTWDGASTAMWSTTTGGATGASVPGTADAVILDAATCVGGTTCTITVAASIGGTSTIQSITMGACTASTAGCILDFSANNPSITLSSQFSITGAGTRALKLGSGTFTLSAGSGAVLDCTTCTSAALTLTAGTATILVNGGVSNSRSIILGTSLSWPTITVSNTGSNGWYTDINATTGTTIANLNLTAPVMVRFASSIIYTITNAFTWAGTAFNNAILIQSNVNVTPTIAAASGSTINWGAIAGITFSGTTVNATNSFDLKGNSGVTITGPSSGGGGHIIGG